MSMSTISKPTVAGLPLWCKALALLSFLWAGGKVLWAFSCGVPNYVQEFPMHIYRQGVVIDIPWWYKPVGYFLTGVGIANSVFLCIVGVALLLRKRLTALCFRLYAMLDLCLTSSLAILWVYVELSVAEQWDTATSTFCSGRYRDLLMPNWFFAGTFLLGISFSVFVLWWFSRRRVRGEIAEWSTKSP